MSGAEIAAEIAEALAEVGEATGDGTLYCTFKREPSEDDPWDEADPGNPALFELTAFQSQKQIRDKSGTLIGKTVTVLTIDATGVAPLKSDVVVVGVRKTDVTEATKFHQVADIETTAPGGVALMHEVMLSD